jgi:uncharacterized phage protein (predicted DNA packaging)
MLNDLKKVLRATEPAFDDEIKDLINASIQDLKLSGVLPAKADDDTDPLIRRAITTYVKAHFGWDNPDFEKLVEAYNMLKMHLTLSKEYTEIEAA